MKKILVFTLFMVLLMGSYAFSAEDAVSQLEEEIIDVTDSQDESESEETAAEAGSENEKATTPLPDPEAVDGTDIAPDTESEIETVEIFGPGAELEPELEPEPVSERLKDQGDGTVLDIETGLLWLIDADIVGSKIPWQTAKQYISDMNEGTKDNFGYDDWRMPTIQELASLFDKKQFYPAIPKGHPFKNVSKRNHYWSSSAGFNIVGYVWLADMATGTVKYDYISYCNFQHVWPVRSTENAVDLSGKVVYESDSSDLGLSFESLACEDVAVGKRPMPPMGVSAVATSPTEIVVSWQKGREKDDIAWYKVYMGGKLKETIPETFLYFESLRPKSKRCFSVSSYNVAGMESRKSAQACTSTWAKPADGTVWAEGINTYGQLGDGTLDDRKNLVRNKKLKDIEKLAAGVEHAVALRSDGTVWAWGRNQRGQLGDGTTRDRLIPVKIKGLSDIKDIAAGWYHTLALQSDGTVWAWGRNYYGQLGDGTINDKNTPVKVSKLKGITKIAAGWYHSLAIKSDGTVWSWGWNHKGQLGYGETGDRKIPVQVLGLKNAKDIAGGMYHSLAVTENGKVWAWGWNAYGQLGSGTKMDTKFPINIKGIKDIIQVNGGMHYSLALKSDGTVWAWGRNDYGQIASKSASQFELPRQIKDVDNIKKIAAGAHHAVALKEDGSVWSWGWDYGAKQKESPPTRISGIKEINSVAAGIHFTMVLKK
jgi:alpha-tubulin suppressor-like RCC1 family protein